MERNEKSLRRFGQRLAVLREQKQLSIGDLSKRSGVNSRQLIRIEAGQVNILFTTILALARGLGITPEELLEFL
jgi:transcriptional regulator with XRE-family HTH domain